MRVPVTLLIATLPCFLSVLAHLEKDNARSVGIAIPISRSYEIRSADGAVDLKRLKDSTQRRVNALAARASNFERNTGTPHPLAKRNGPNPRCSKRATGSEPLEVNNFFWSGNMLVGTPPKPFNMLFDIGNADAFVPSKNCTTSCEGHNRYDPSASTTAVNLNKTFELKFGSDSSNIVSGGLYSDTFSVAGLTALNQTFGAALTYAREFGKQNRFPDGLVGMARRNLSSFGARPYFETLVAQGRVDRPEFAIKLAKNGSELFLGGVNHKQYKGSFTYVPALPMGFWATLVDGVIIDGHHRVPLSITNAIIDTGSNVIIGNKNDVVEIYKLIPGSQPAAKYNLPEGYFTIPCNTTTVVSLLFGQKAFPMSPEAFNLGPVSNGSDTCLGGMVYDTALTNIYHSWIVGVAFLQCVYSVFNTGTNQIGFAALASAH